MSRLRLSPSIFRDTDVLLQCLIVRTTAGRLQIYALPKSTTRSTASFYLQRGLSRAMAFTFTDCTWCSVYLEKIGLQILRPRDNVARETRSMASRLQAVFERETDWKVMGKRCLLGLSCLALFIAFDPSFAAQIEVVAKKQKPLIGKSSASRPSERYPWKGSIVTTIFWIGEQPGGKNLVPNRTSAWDKQWTKNYGGFDDPNPAHRSNYIPKRFTPRQNPFYCALPYNDKARNGHRPEAPRVVPWFKEAYRGPAVSTCKDRWVAIRKRNRIAYAQWEDAGPFRTDHWQYVFGNERPKPNLNKGAGLDVSPAVRDYLGLDETDVTDWQFVDFKDVPRGPWSKLGENNTFVIADRNAGTRLARSKSSAVRKLHLLPSN